MIELAEEWWKAFWTKYVRPTKSVVDSKVVNKRIRAEIWPLMKQHGFSKFTSRSAWRLSNGRIDVLNFQSFNSYNASRIDVTTYSFAINLGSFFVDAPREHRMEGLGWGDGLKLPAEYHCHFRGSLRKTIAQEGEGGRSIWYIDPKGRYLEPVIADARAVIERNAFTWFERLADPGEVRRILLDEDESMDDALWGFGGKGSPVRQRLLKHFVPSNASLVETRD